MACKYYGPQGMSAPLAMLPRCPYLHLPDLMILQKMIWKKHLRCWQMLRTNPPLTTCRYHREWFWSRTFSKCFLQVIGQFKFILKLLQHSQSLPKNLGESGRRRGAGFTKIYVKHVKHLWFYHEFPISQNWIPAWLVKSLWHCWWKKCWLVGRNNL